MAHRVFLLTLFLWPAVLWAETTLFSPVPRWTRNPIAIEWEPPFSVIPGLSE